MHYGAGSNRLLSYSTQQFADFYCSYQAIIGTLTGSVSVSARYSRLRRAQTRLHARHGTDEKSHVQAACYSYPQNRVGDLERVRRCRCIRGGLEREIFTTGRWRWMWREVSRILCRRLRLVVLVLPYCIGCFDYPGLWGL